MSRLAGLAVASVLLSIIIAGCATPSLGKAECATADWRAIGYADGAAGYGAERVAEHRKACARFGVSPDLAAYNNGREEGLGQYCTVPKGLALGRADDDCAICGNFANVVAACRHGRRIHAVDLALASVDESIARADREIARARNWTPERELTRELSRIDRLISRQQSRIDSRISRNEKRIEETREDGGPQSEIDEANRNIGALRKQRSDLDLERERRRADARVAHERNRDNLVTENLRKLSEQSETKAANEQSRSELHAELAALLEEADALR